MEPSASWKSRAAVLAAALWWGSVTVIGFVVVPLLFSYLPTPAMAGNMAARLFSAQTWIALACGVLLLFASRSAGEGERMDWGRGALIFVIAGVLLALLTEFAVAPRIVARQNLKLWHGIGSAMYVAQWLCASVVGWKLTSPPATSPRERTAIGD
jgi:hypothetical protein